MAAMLIETKSRMRWALPRKAAEGRRPTTHELVRRLLRNTSASSCRAPVEHSCRNAAAILPWRRCMEQSTEPFSRPDVTLVDGKEAWQASSNRHKLVQHYVIVAAKNSGARAHEHALAAGPQVLEFEELFDASP
jgi:hypothetical protein